MKFLDIAEKILKEEQQPLSAKEIWSIAVRKGYDKELKKLGKTPSASLRAQLYVNSTSESSRFKKSDLKPTKFLLR